jgi:hypothetical protein
MLVVSVIGGIVPGLLLRLLLLFIVVHGFADGREVVDLDFESALPKNRQVLPDTICGIALVGDPGAIERIYPGRGVAAFGLKVPDAGSDY